MPNILHKIRISDTDVKQVSTVKILGVHLDEHLSWDVHVQEITKNLSRFNPTTYKCRNSLPLFSIKLLYNALI